MYTSCVAKTISWVKCIEHSKVFECKKFLNLGVFFIQYTWKTNNKYKNTLLFTFELESAFGFWWHCVVCPTFPFLSFLNLFEFENEMWFICTLLFLFWNRYFSSLFFIQSTKSFLFFLQKVIREVNFKKICVFVCAFYNGFDMHHVKTVTTNFCG